MPRSAAKIIFVLILLNQSLPAIGDTIYLKNGNKLQGIVESETADKIMLDVGSGRTAIKKKDIDRVDKSDVQEQAKLKETWAEQYFLSSGLVPLNLKSLAEEFQKLQDLKARAAISRRAKEAGALKLAKLEKNCAALIRKLKDTGQNLKNTDPVQDPDKYNAIVTEHNSLTAELELVYQDKQTLSRACAVQDKAVNGYTSQFTIFKNNFLRSRANAANPEEKKFLQKLEAAIDELQKDFNTHRVNYQQSPSGIVVDVLLNSTLATGMIVDTGASLVVLPQQIAARLNILIDADTPVLYATLADGKKVKSFAVTLDSVKVGDTEIKNVPAAVIEDAAAGDTTGLLGLSFLENFLITVDAKNNSLILEEFTPR